MYMNTLTLVDLRKRNPHKSLILRCLRNNTHKLFCLPIFYKADKSLLLKEIEFNFVNGRMCKGVENHYAVTFFISINEKFSLRQNSAGRFNRFLVNDDWLRGYEKLPSSAVLFSYNYELVPLADALEGKIRTKSGSILYMKSLMLLGLRKRRAGKTIHAWKCSMLQ